MRSYLDHASTSVIRPEARAAICAYLDGPAGDPGRIHLEGMRARGLLEQAREQLAAFVGSRPREVVFTSGATEAITAACFGALTKSPERAHAVFSKVEHSAVREASARKWTPGVDFTEIGVDFDGLVDPDSVAQAIRPDTAIVHIQWVNHEVGSIQPVREVVELCRSAGVLVHVDAAQAVGHLEVDFADLGADLMSVSGHKFGGPAGTGALLIRRGLRLPSLLVGGDQERARRAGMENVASLVGLGAAAEAATGSWKDEADKQRRLNEMVRAWADQCSDVVVYGRSDRVAPHISCLGLAGVEPQPVLLGLDQRQVAVHSGSSCSSESLEPSPVLEAMGVDAQRSLRISTGWNSTAEDIARFVEAIQEVLHGLSELRHQSSGTETFGSSPTEDSQVSL